MNAYLSLICICFGIVQSVHAQSAAWLDDHYTYRATLKLDRPVSGRVAMDLPADLLADQLKTVAVDEISPLTLAFEQAKIIDATSGNIVGKYVLLPKGAPLHIDGDFSALGTPKSPWSGWSKESVPIGRETIDGKSRSAMRIRKEQLTNSKLSQMVKLNQGSLYLLDYYVWSDPVEYNIVIDLYNPAKTYFPKLKGSYTSPLTVKQQWVHVRALKLADVAEAELRIENAFSGECRVAGVQLQEVEWKAVADLLEKSDELQIYINAIGGHYMSQPADDTLAKIGGNRVKVEHVSAERIDLNPHGLLINGKSIRAWSVPADIPLIADKIASLMPADAGGELAATLLNGSVETKLLAMETRTPLARILKAESTLPVDVKFERIAEVPLYDGPFPQGKLIASRFDAMVPLDYELMPPASAGVHMVAATLKTLPDTKAGDYSGVLRITVQTQEPAIETIEVPIKLRVLSYTVKPMRHFGTMFGTTTMAMRVGMDAGVTRRGNSTLEFFGQADDSDLALARAYCHRMVDFFITPENPPHKMPTCQVKDRGQDEAPELTGWNFESLDAAIDEFILGRDMPWMMIARSNGQIMNSLRLPNGDTYSFDDGGSAANWKRVSRKAYFELVANYYEALAAHFDSRGILDRAVYVVDESMPETYPLIVEFVQAVRSTPHGKRIHFGNTSDKTSYYTREKPDGSPLLDGIIDMPMNMNDEFSNYYEPELAARMKQPGRNQWVYYVETTHMTLDQAGLSTAIAPLKLKELGANGWYCWAATLWSWPAMHSKESGPRWPLGPTLNPWMNPFYHHGPGALAFFYPPDPRGIPSKPVTLMIPSYRLSLMRDGIQQRAILEMLQAGVDDAQRPITVDAEKLASAMNELKFLWAKNPTQWYLSYGTYRNASRLLYESF